MYGLEKMCNLDFTTIFLYTFNIFRLCCAERYLLSSYKNLSIYKKSNIDLYFLLFIKIVFILEMENKLNAKKSNFMFYYFHISRFFI